MELKKGMYVRIKNEAGYSAIGKIENINDYREPNMKYCIDIQADDFVFIPEDMIVKASNNIIDLIEVGDYVNGYKLLYQDSHYSYFDTDTCDWIYIKKDEQIKSIVTKEQFESIGYKVGEKAC